MKLEQYITNNIFSYCIFNKPTEYYSRFHPEKVCFGKNKMSVHMKYRVCCTNTESYKVFKLSRNTDKNVVVVQRSETEVQIYYYLNPTLINL